MSKESVEGRLLIDELSSEVIGSRGFHGKVSDMSVFILRKGIITRAIISSIRESLEIRTE